MDADQNNGESMTLKYALGFIKKSIPVFPVWEAVCGACACGNPDCKSVGKHPVEYLVPHGVLDSTLDLEKVRQWWTAPIGRENANIGVKTGGKLVVVDIDPRHNGNESFAKLIEKHGPLPDTVEVATGGGGRHLYLTYAQGEKNPLKGRIGLMPGIDVKSTGGYVVAPPSMHASGHRYKFIPGHNNLAPAPDWLVNIINNGSEEGARPRLDTPTALEGVPHGQRYYLLISLAGRFRYANIPFEFALPLMYQAGYKCTPPASRADVEEILRKAYQKWKPGDRQSLEDQIPENPFAPPAHWQTLDYADLTSWDCPELEWICKPLFARGQVVILAAATQTGKTLLSLNVAEHILTGEKLFEHFEVKPVQKVLYLVLEDPPRRIKARLLDQIRGLGPTIEKGRFHLHFAPGLKLNDDLCFQHFEDMIAKENYNAAFVDTYQKATPGISSFDDERQSIVLHRIADITRKFNTMLWSNDHFRKTENSQKGRPRELTVDDIKGTSAKAQNADVFLLMDRTPEGQLRIRGSSKDADEPIAFLLDVAAEGDKSKPKFSWAGNILDMRQTQKEKGDQNHQAVLDHLLKINDWDSAEAVGKATGMTKKTAMRHLSLLIDENKVIKRGSNRNTQYRAVTENLAGQTTGTDESPSVPQQQTIWKQ